MTVAEVDELKLWDKFVANKASSHDGLFSAKLSLDMLYKRALLLCAASNVIQLLLWF
jgi:hypothetical protein